MYLCTRPTFVAAHFESGRLLSYLQSRRFETSETNVIPACPSLLQQTRHFIDLFYNRGRNAGRIRQSVAFETLTLVRSQLREVFLIRVGVNNCLHLNTQTHKRFTGSDVWIKASIAAFTSASSPHRLWVVRANI